VFVFILLVFSARDIFAEETAAPEEYKTFSFTVYPCLLPLKWFSAEAEYAFSERGTFALEGKYWNYGETDGRYEWKWKRLETSLGIRAYYTKVQDGFFIGIYLNFLYVNVELDDNYYDSLKGHCSYNTFGYTGWVGYKWIISNAILEVSTGLSYYAPTRTKITVSDEYFGRTYTEESPIKIGLCWPGIGLGFGIAF